MLRQRYLEDELTEGRQALGERGGDLSCQRLHGSYVHDLEALSIDAAVLVSPVRADLSQHGYHGDVGLAGSRGSTNQQIVVAGEGRGENSALDAVQGPVQATNKKSWHMLAC